MIAFTKRVLLKLIVAVQRRPTQGSDWAGPLTILVTMGFATIAGLSIPILGFVVPAIVGALVLSVCVLALPPLIIIWLMLILVLLVVGQLTFFLGIQQAMWLPYLMLLLIAVKYLLERLRITNLVATPLSLSSISILIGLSCLSFFLSALANMTDFASMGVAAKNYIFPWFLTLLVASAIQRTDDLKGIWEFLLWVVVAQLPFAVLQHFYFANQAGAGWDAVVGTFGGNFLTGGGSGAMAIYLVFGIVLAASLSRRKQISNKFLIGVVLAALVTVALAEIKIFFICMPIGLILLFRHKILTNPLQTIGFSTLGAILLGSVLLVYQQSYSEKNISKTSSIEGFADYVFTAESDPYFFNAETRELSRIGAILMWWRYNDPNELRFYIGHGPASSRESKTLGIGLTARKYPFTLSTSTASAMLWDVGLTGYILMLGILLFGGINAFRRARHAPPMEASVLDSIAVMLLLNLPLTFYNRDLIDSSATQVSMAFWIGYVLLCRKNMPTIKKMNNNSLRFAP